MENGMLIWACIFLFLVCVIMILEYKKRSNEKLRKERDSIDYNYYDALMIIIAKLLISKDKKISLQEIVNFLPSDKGGVATKDIIDRINNFPLIYCYYDVLSEYIIIDSEKTKEKYQEFTENVEESLQ